MSKEVTKDASRADRAVYLVGAARTPIGAFGGALAEVPAPVLGSAAVRAALARSGVPADQIDEVIFGNVVSAGLGQNVARQVTLGAGLPQGVGATTVNKVCGSGLKAVMLAAQAIRCGDASIVVAGGAESMSRAPYLLDKARAGYRMGNGQLIDAMIRDGLWDVYHDKHMGACGDACAARYHFSREQQDEFAAASYRRALAAQAAGAFDAEIIPIDTPAGKTAATTASPGNDASRNAAAGPSTARVTEDEGPRKFNEDKLKALRPAFGPDGTITAGNASSINDGAAAVVVASGEKVEALGLRPLARVLGSATVAREPEWFTLAPVGALAALLGRLSLAVADVDLFEINEAFSVVPMVAMKELAIAHARVNVHGGAVALGHPIGASGARTLVTLLHALRRRGRHLGIVTLCLGGGEAVAMAVEAM